MTSTRVDDERLVPIAGTTISDGKKSRCGCYVQYEITFSESCRDVLSSIAFDNYYVATICIEQRFPIEREDDGQTTFRYTEVLSHYDLMRNVHYEDDAQDSHLIFCDLFNETFDASNLTALRIKAFNASFVWRQFNLRRITCLGQRVATIAPTPTPRDTTAIDGLTVPIPDAVEAMNRLRQTRQILSVLVKECTKLTKASSSYRSQMWFDPSLAPPYSLTSITSAPPQDLDPAESERLADVDA